MDFQKPDFITLSDLFKYCISFVVVLGGYIINKKLTLLDKVAETVQGHESRFVKIEKDIEYIRKDAK